MTVEDLIGEYTIVGKNQDFEATQYSGTLKLTLNEHNRIEASWAIGTDQKQFGTGFFKNNILVINFYYKAEHSIFKGVAVYKCLTKDVLEGFWSEKYGDPNFLGEEHCFRKGSHKEAVN